MPLEGLILIYTTVAAIVIGGIVILRELPKDPK